MADEVNTEAFNGGDTEAATKAAIAARNTALQAQADAATTAGATFQTATNDYYDALGDAETTALEADPGLKTGDPINVQAEEE